jgi:hypothetical protein
MKNKFNPIWSFFTNITGIAEADGSLLPGGFVKSHLTVGIRPASSPVSTQIMK